MINNDRQYQAEQKTRYNDDVLSDDAVNSARNSYSGGGTPVKEPLKRNSTAGFEKLLDSPVDSPSPDLVPTNTTMQFNARDRKYLYEDFHAEKEKDHLKSDENAEYRINTKGKIMITVYALVVLTIFTLIILNTRLLKDMSASISEKEAQVTVMQEELASLNDRLEFVSSDEEIIRQAVEKGMVYGGND